jgi:hypothetical protein
MKAQYMEKSEEPDMSNHSNRSVLDTNKYAEICVVNFDRFVHSMLTILSG